MGFTDLFSNLYAAMTFTELHAEAPEQQEEEKEGGDKESKSEEGEEDDEGDKGEEKEGGDEEEKEEEDGEGGKEDEEEEEEEEEEEPEDPKPKLEEECAHSAQCAPLLHHYEECRDRVLAPHEAAHKGHKNEDCLEEFFHLQHCAAQCAAPKLFRQLK